MTCNGCQPLLGQVVELTAPVTITATGLTAQELLRVTIPPMDDPVELQAIVRPASLVTATTVDMQTYLMPAGTNILTSIDLDARELIPFTDVNAAGLYERLHAIITTPGDYILGATKIAGNGQVFASSIGRTRLWWRR